ncbi:uncharacterized protein N7459_009196 [Penicillium hispanicum]|uniref:uncharacterized protein n=1 Tax=Penicillium hispanicum TaxID=1080232 RepID=UPI0025425BFD|nr:uncharacterized protein N7459_009196 [Penicillium hispanicum]KAJ5569766.1 hypothetical protein N7459_009196 [Penicillium hispanicum]
MSFLDSVLSSLQTGNPSQLPLSQPPAPPVTSSAQKKDDRKSGTAPCAPPSGANANGGTKRKAEEQLPRPPRPEPQATGKPLATRPAPASGASKAGHKLVSKPNSVPSSKLAASKPISSIGSPAASKTAPKPAAAKPTPSPSKPPPKGSYADLMMQAKAMQDKAPVNLGQLRHQAVPKERLSKVERKRRLMEAKAKEKAARLGKKITSKDKASATKSEPQGPSYKGTAKPPTKTPEVPTYRGTAGLPGSRGANDRRAHGKRRMDEYLGTDEEDEGDYGGYDDGYSDESSDMEAGFDDVEEEEDVALKSARREDEDELRMEMAAKKEKMERQKRLAALASRTKR